MDSDEVVGLLVVAVVFMFGVLLFTLYAGLYILFYGGLIAAFLFLLSVAGILPFSWVNVGIAVLGLILLRSIISFNVVRE